jgi:hypothetical protein
MANEVTIQGIEIKRVDIKVNGTAPLIVHKWSEKAKKEMLDKQMKKAKAGRETKNPQNDYEESLYKTDDGKYGFPAVAFKAAMVGAGAYCEFKKTYLRGAFHINCEMVEINGEPTMREDMVRVGMGTADIRYRGEFKQWSATLPITYNARAISVEQILNLIMIAGFAIGIGEWRPERDGNYGRFEIAQGVK